MDVRSELRATVQAVVEAGKGILAADESGPTIAKRFKGIRTSQSLQSDERTAAFSCEAAACASDAQARAGWGPLLAMLRQHPQPAC
jgi:fructose-bisphosphate aldolase class 1